MEKEFWRERWVTGKTGWHQAEVEPHLRAHFEQLKLRRGSTVLVPLCGKTLDLVWLAEQGYKVLGVELSTVACEAFFSENKLALKPPLKKGGFVVHRARQLPISIYEGDFFALKAPHVGTIGALYDKASLIALPPPMRKRYVQHLKKELLSTRTRGLLITTFYDQSTYPGPPFSVAAEEVKKLWSDRFAIERVAEGYKQLGAVKPLETAWTLKPLPKS